MAVISWYTATSPHQAKDSGSFIPYLTLPSHFLETTARLHLFDSGGGHMVTTMKIKQELPPNYMEIVKALGTPPDRVIYCYGDTIYNPSGKEITPDLGIHEQVHSKQQGTAPDLWWDKYLSDPQFRLYQEIEAYGEQYLFAQKLIDEIRGGAKMKRWALTSMAKALSGPEYGGIISYSQAETAIRKYGTR